MEFKIDTKPTYTVITPSQNVIDDKMTDELAQKIEECINNGSTNFIIDIEQCKTADNTSLTKLLELHTKCYDAQYSFVITGMNDSIKELAKKADIADELNIAPTMIEAVDIVSMEILERDLLSGE